MKEGVDCREVPLWVLGAENDDKNNIWHRRGSHVNTMVISVNMQIFRGLKNNHCNGKMTEASNIYRKMISQSDVRPPRGRIMFALLIFYNIWCLWHLSVAMNVFQSPEDLHVYRNHHCGYVRPSLVSYVILIIVFYPEDSEWDLSAVNPFLHSCNPFYSV